MSPHSLAIYRHGLACSLGVRSRPAIAAMRAGITRFAQLPDRPDVTVSRLTTLSDGATWLDRVTQLATHAIREVAQRPFPWPKDLPLYTVLRQTGAEDRFLQQLPRLVASIAGAQVSVKPIRAGRAGVFVALSEVAAACARGEHTIALVCAADTLVDSESLAALESQNLLLSTANLDGRIPGEAAVVLLVGNADAIPSQRATTSVTAIACDVEAASFQRCVSGRAVGRADALTRVFRSLSPAFETRCEAIYTGQSCESFWQREFNLAYLRNVSVMPEPLRHYAAAYELGDLGAAAGAAALALAISDLDPSAFAHTRAPGFARALVYDMSDDGHVGALAAFRAGVA